MLVAIMQMKSHRLTLTLSAALSLLACREPQPPHHRVVGEWVRASQLFARTEQLSPPVAARMAAYGSLALYEGHAADKASGLRSLAGQVNGLWSVPIPPRDRHLDGATVAAEAQRVVLDSLYSEAAPTTRRAIESLATGQIAERRSAGVSAERIQRSIAHGHSLGGVILAWAASDGFLETRGRRWTPPKSASAWAMTAPMDGRAAPPRPGEVGIVLAGRDASGRDRARPTTLPRLDPWQPTEPHWGTLRTFALRNSDECAPPIPPQYSEQRGSEFWKMGREFYDTVSSLAKEQRDVAVHWADTAVGPGPHWLSLLDAMITSSDLTADQAAEAYALTSVAIADAFIGSWRQKYQAMRVRPATYVQRVFDSRWRSQLTPAASPEYPSESAAVSGAVTEVLTQVLGDSIAFTDSSRTGTALEARSFVNMIHARDEAVLAPVYGGVHFLPSAVHGLAQGQCIGQRVAGRLKTR
jgi:hypothetical protein